MENKCLFFPIVKYIYIFNGIVLTNQGCSVRFMKCWAPWCVDFYPHATDTSSQHCPYAWLILLLFFSNCVSQQWGFLNIKPLFQLIFGGSVPGGGVAGAWNLRLVLALRMSGTLPLLSLFA